MLTAQSCPSPSSLSPCSGCASLVLSISGINPCSLSPAPHQSLLLLDAHCVSPGVARHSHCLSRCLPGLLRCCHRLPPELFTAGPAPSPAPARRLRYSSEIQSPAGCWLSQPTFAPARGAPRQPVAQRGVSAIWQSSLLMLHKGLNPFPITEKRESGTDSVPVLSLSLASQSAAAPSPSPSSRSTEDSASLALLGRGAGTQWHSTQGTAGRECWPQRVSQLQGSIIKGLRSLR